MIKDKTIEDLWADAKDYIPQSIEDVEKELRIKFKKRPNCLYIGDKDMNNLLGTDKKPFNFDKFNFNRYYTRTVLGNFLIFERFKTLKGVKVYELNDDTGYYIIENKKGNRYFFSVNDTKAVKTIGNTLIFVDYDSNLTVYDIDKDYFEC